MQSDRPLEEFAQCVAWNDTAADATRHESICWFSQAFRCALAFGENGQGITPTEYKLQNYELSGV